MNDTLGAESGFMQQMRQFGIGQPVRRVGDRRFMTRKTLWRRIREATTRRAA